MNKFLRFFTITSLLASATLPMEARQLTPGEAIDRIATSSAPSKLRSLSQKSTSLAYTATDGVSGLNTIYAFNMKQGGFMIVSADDAAQPLLGYSDSGSFDIERISSTTKWWLDQYSRQVAYAAALRQQSPSVDFRTENSAPRKITAAAIEPLVESMWGQDAPYYNDCPQLKGKQTVTGCVATALAQVVNYHKYPAKGTGTYSYRWNSGNKQLSYDYGNAIFNYSDMLDRYYNSQWKPLGTDAQKAAVANLMYACGVGVQMDYGVEGSGAISLRLGRVLLDNFNYASSVRYVERDYYQAVGDWDQLVYNELAAGRPVLYGGATANNEGHQFVCDGFDGQGLFHINWGWNGMSDGYFRLSALNPDDQGTGGASDGSGFDYGQDIVIGIQKPSQASGVFDPYLLSCGDMIASIDGSELLITYSAADKRNFIGSYNWMEMPVYLGVKIVNKADNSVEYLKFPELIEYPAITDNFSFGIMTEFSVPFDASKYKAGEYEIYAVDEYMGKWFDVIPAPNSKYMSVMTVDANGNITFTPSRPTEVTPPQQGTPSLTVNEFYPESDVVLPDVGYDYYISIENNGDADFSGKVVLYVDDEDTSETVWGIYINGISIGAGQSISGYVNLTLDVEPGFYNFHFTDAADQPVSDNFRILIGYPATSLTLDNYTLNLNVDDAPVKLKASLLPVDVAITALEWESSNPQAAAVSEDGLVTPVAAGMSLITVKTIDGSNLSATCDVSVTPKTSGINSIDLNGRVSVFTPEGLLLERHIDAAGLNSLPQGVYIVVSDNKEVRKLIK